MKQIPLSNGGFTDVDDEDFERMSESNWCSHKGRHTSYAVHCVKRNKQTRMFYLHRMIIDAQKGSIVDHIDGNGLNNQKANLRLVTQRQNIQNFHFKKSSKYIGVSLHHGRWEARISVGGVTKYLGGFDKEEDASQAYIDACGKMEEDNG